MLGEIPLKLLITSEFAPTFPEHALIRFFSVPRDAVLGNFPSRQVHLNSMFEISVYYSLGMSSWR